ncbi:uncharacterized protein LOC127243311 isoform X2 [Andrographis paniculata]|uniref:uncharacterized protein LOC127243311 isoform X2 n=1 Tax=Andrographis paniculata TaxID=175694 RepID=UPI0021E85A3D|nr:uncharacterized protein LOC127243311 isoform X2 [Andrographis paniculata]
MASPDEAVSDSDSDDGFKADLDALGRACRLTGKNPDDNPLPQSRPGAGHLSESGDSDGDDYGADDLQLVRSIQDRFAIDEESLSAKPLCMLPADWSDSDNCEDDYETLRAIQRRFSAYNDGGLKAYGEDITFSPVQVGATIISSEKESTNRFVERTNAREGFLNCVDASEPPVQSSKACDDAGGRQTSDFVECNGPVTDDLANLPIQTSHFPDSALVFIDAIKKNRSCQKLLRSKMLQLEARAEELKKLINRVKILKDFQLACKRKTGRALSQKKDPRVQLISVPKLRATKKFNENKVPAAYKGPPENIHVTDYKETLERFAVSVNLEKWSKEDREKLLKGVKQQYQGMLLQQSVDGLSDADGSYGSSNVDSIMGSIKDLDVTPEKIRSFLPEVNWNQLASMYVPSHSGAECQARFLNFEDPLINHNPWTTMEDKNLLHIVQQKGVSNWLDIAASLGTNRTPFQCLARYQRSLNASILKREWTKEEDDQLRAAVETFGESNWQLVASVLEGRAGTQCSNRWLKTLHPARRRVGKWTEEEDKRLKVAVTLFGAKTWKKVASCVPGRTHVQCRERWVNCLNPSLNTAEWSEEEDYKLEVAIKEHGYCWSKVAGYIPHRTDNQCWRRWKVLFPNEVPRLQEDRKIQRAALISNFVDRESEKPSLGPNDFVLPKQECITGSEIVGSSTTQKRGSRRRKAGELVVVHTPSSKMCSGDIPCLTNDCLVENVQHRPRCTNRRRRGEQTLAIEKHSSTSKLSPSPSPDTVLTVASRCEDVGSCVKSKSLYVDDHAPSAADEGHMGAIDQQVVDHELLGGMEEYSLESFVNLHPDAEAVGGGPATSKSYKASKLQPRRRNCRTLEEGPPEVRAQSGDGAMSKTRKRSGKRSDLTNDQSSHFPNTTSTSPMSVGEEVGVDCGAKGRKRRRKCEEICSSIDCASLAVDGQNAIATAAAAVDGDEPSLCQSAVVVWGDMEDLSVYSSDRENDIIRLSETGDSNAAPAPAPAPAPASLLVVQGGGGGADGARRNGDPGKLVGNSHQAPSSSAGAVIPEKRRGRNGSSSSSSSSSSGNGRLEEEEEEDTTLAALYQKLKKRKFRTRAEHKHSTAKERSLPPPKNSKTIAIANSNT